jgi:hypothetical protein
VLRDRIAIDRVRSGDWAPCRPVTAAATISVSPASDSAASPAEDPRAPSELSIINQVLDAVDGVGSAEQLASQLDRLTGQSVGDHLSNRLAAEVRSLEPSYLAIWAEALAPSGAAAGLWSGRARRDLNRAHALAASGHRGEAEAVLRVLYWRAANNGGAVEGVQRDEITALLPSIEPHTPHEPDSPPLRPVRLVFVGGNEVQARQVPEIERTLEQHHDGTVQVKWIHPKWDSNWVPHADRVASRLQDCDAIVVMKFVRTNLGERLRSLSSAAGVPWVACTGHGRASMVSAIHEAVGVANKLAERMMARSGGSAPSDR